MIIPTYKYRLHCFGCGILFINKTEVHRYKNRPYCECCLGDMLSHQAASEYYDYIEEKKWKKWKERLDYAREHGLPEPPDPEEQELLNTLVRKYGEC